MDLCQSMLLHVYSLNVWRCSLVEKKQILMMLMYFISEELSEEVKLKALKTTFKSCITNDGSIRKKSKAPYKYHYYLFLFFTMLT